MATKRKIHVIRASAPVPASPERVYAVIADYRQGHPSILPREFTGMSVEQGGVGTGTVIRFQMKLFGLKRTFRAAITEPQPGRVLVETNLETNGAVTTFIVDRGQGVGDSEVTITTELPLRTGILGAWERFLSTRLLHPIYVRELALLAAIFEVHK